MSRTALSLSAIALMAQTATAELSRVSISGIVTQAQSTDGMFEGMRVGDTWTFDMLIERTPRPAWDGTIDLTTFDPWDFTWGFDVVSATFSTRVGSMSVSEFDLGNFNRSVPFLPFSDSMTPEERALAEAREAAANRFDMLIFDYDPTSVSIPRPGDSDFSLNHPYVRVLQRPDVADLSYLESILPLNILGRPSAVDERWSKMSLDGAYITSRITDYLITGVSGRVVPAPSGLAVLGGIGLIGTRRRR